MNVAYHQLHSSSTNCTLITITEPVDPTILRGGAEIWYGEMSKFWQGSTQNVCNKCGSYINFAMFKIIKQSKAASIDLRYFIKVSV